ncbi:DUF4124 domain-containing protein [Luteimonas aquatica]|uniref:DUF4124 domain-containing protein n=1 Tax=Luteimonas aquatica TaxID=450364 RepID=UPI001F574E07|nr:DUF4124 domain-containing protein [Luteimonas aquatica]
MARRSRHRLLIASALTAALAAFGPVAAPAAPLGAGDTLTIYRCTDARGRVTVQDAPCRKGEDQQAQEMLRPRDPPPRPALTAAPIAPMPAPAPPAQTLIVRNPQPMFECVRPDGSSYVSDSGEGNPRWIPAWASDDPYMPYYPIPLGAGGIYESRTTVTGGPAVSANLEHRGRDGSVQLRIDSAPVDVADAYRRPHRPPRHYPVYGYGAAGTWVRDACHALPQAEICDRLHDRRAELRRRFFNAQPTERATLDKEERGINARLSADCGGS